MMYSADEACDVGADTGSARSPDYGPTGNKFTGEIDWVQIDLGDDSHDHLIKPEDRLSGRDGAAIRLPLLGDSEAGRNTPAHNRLRPGKPVSSSPDDEETKMSYWIRAWAATAGAVLALASAPAAIVTIASPAVSRADVCMAGQYETCRSVREHP